MVRPDTVTSVRIVSVNTWGGRIFDPLAGWLGTVGADVLCLQEVTRTPRRTGWVRYANGENAFPQRANLLADVRQVLPAHQAIFVAAESGPVLDPSGGRHRQDFGIATLVDEHLPLVGLDTAFVHGSFTDHDSWPSTIAPRAALAVRVLDRTTGRRVAVIQLHGLRDPSGKHDTAERRAQARRLAELVQRSQRDADLTVVCGDLNLLPDSETFQILGELGLVDLVGTADTRTSHYPKPVRHADYALVSDPSAVTRFAILAEPEVSDHRALLLEL